MSVGLGHGPIWVANDTGGFIGDLWMWLQLKWLHFEGVRGPVGVDLRPVWGHLGPKSSPNDFERTSDNLKLQPHELQPHP